MNQRDLHSYFSKLGQRGGRARSEKKLSASMRNLTKSRTWKKHSEGNGNHSIPRDQAKQQILDYFKQSKDSVTFREISEKLHLDLGLVSELSGELEKEGFLE